MLFKPSNTAPSAFFSLPHMTQEKAIEILSLAMHDPDDVDEKDLRSALAIAIASLIAEKLHL
ncbi:hypothetical protein ES708_34896 [subsurface metagenome]